MSYGLKVWGSDGTLRFDSTAHAGGVLIESLTIPYSSASGYKDYTDSDLTNRSLLLQQVYWGSHELTPSIVNGFPRLSWTRKNNTFSYDTIVWVFAR